jgi:hypothetical protein
LKIKKTIQDKNPVRLSCPLISRVARARQCPSSNQRNVRWRSSGGLWQGRLRASAVSIGLCASGSPAGRRSAAADAGLTKAGGKRLIYKTACFCRFDFEKIKTNFSSVSGGISRRNWRPRFRSFELPLRISFVR